MRRTIAIVWIAIASACLHEGAAQESTPKAIVELGEPGFEPMRTVETYASQPDICVGNIDELRLPPTIDREDPRLKLDRLIVVVKRDRRLMLYSQGRLRHDRVDNGVDCWRVAFGIDRHGRSTSTADKSRQGDRRTPEGFMRLSDKPWSQFDHAIAMHYPTLAHATKGLERGLISEATFARIRNALNKANLPPQDTALGGELLIHGGGSATDWTWGCIAMDNADIIELRSLLPEGMQTWALVLP